jgi:type I restriction enzyme R subunit
VPPEPVRRHARPDHEGVQALPPVRLHGTPIFAENAGSSGNPRLRTTEQAFGDRLAPERIAQVVAYIREHFDQKTKRSFAYSLAGKRLAGFTTTGTSRCLRSRELDLAIVVNMLLTGFDATTLNTLWVDKGLRAHGLIQAYSRTNRILNSVKVYGNIVTFRDLEQETNDALALFGNEDARGIVLLKPYGDYYAEYVARVGELQALFPLDQPVRGEGAIKAFIGLFGAILRLRNILTAFDEFAGNEILSERDYQDYQSVYIDFHAELRQAVDNEKESIIEDVVFEIELVKQVEVNVDYVLMLVEQYREQRGDGTDREVDVLSKISRAIASSISLRNKRDLILAFVASVSVTSDVQDDWHRFVAARREKELEEIIEYEGLVPDKTRAFVERAFRDGAIPRTGASVTEILQPTSRFSDDGGYSIRKQTVLDRLTAFFDRYFALG